MRKDPICGMEVSEDDAATAEYDGKTYYFCSRGCRDRFVKEKACEAGSIVHYDLIIIGGGPAGLTAAVYAATLKMNTIMMSKNLGGQAADSTHIENYMGFDFITGPELIEKFRSQILHSHYIDHLMTAVENIEPAGGGFYVTTSEGKDYYGKALIIATGMTRRRLNVPGEEEFQRKGIFYGSLLDLTFVEGEDAAVIGGGNSALQIVENLHTVAKNIYLISNSALKADPVIIERVKRFTNLISYEECEIIEFTGDKTLSGISIKEKELEKLIGLTVKGAFIAIGLQPNSSLVSHIIELNKNGEIVINSDCSTSCPGIFAAGDVTSASGKRIIIASGEGAKAVLAARQYLLNFRNKK